MNYVYIVRIIGLLIIGVFPVAMGQVAPASQDAYFQEEHPPRDINEKVWKKSTEHMRFELPKEQNQKQSNRSTRGMEKPDASLLPKWFNGTWSQVLWILLFAAGIVFLLRAIRKTSGLKVKEQVVEVEIEKLDVLTPIKEVERMLQEAIERRDYPSSVRLYFLYALQQLQRRNLIRWKKDKTNHDYLLDIQDTSFVIDFQGLVQIYDRVHYGAFRPNEQEFLQMKQYFDNFINMLQRTTPVQKNLTHG